MKTRKNTRKTLLTCIFAMILTVSMFIGTTFAWFTDNVTSANNIIQSGNLDLDVYYGSPEDENSIEGVSTLFDAVEQWEPGAVAYENLTVVNKGSLAAKYLMVVNFINENHMTEGEYKLSQILQVGFVDEEIADDVTREELLDKVQEWQPMTGFEFYGELLANTSDETVGMVVYWEPSGEDNNYNVQDGKDTSDGEECLHVDLGITLTATQYTSESDSFGSDYDKRARIAGMKLGDELELFENGVEVTVPAEAPRGEYKLDVEKYSLSANAKGDTEIKTEITVTLDGEEVVEADAIEFDVTLNTHMMSRNHQLFHNGKRITEFDYNVYTGVISFKTNSFSPFSVSYDVFGTEVVLDENNRIIAGYFTDVNPVMLDSTLLGDDSECIVVDYVKDGKKCYAVSERATTIILGDNDDGGQGYTFENGNYPVTLINDNQLYQYLDTQVNTSVVNDGVYETVYLLPGIYEEQTTLTISSNMDVMGLGDAKNIKVVKVATHVDKNKVSNRHLFNCTNENEYIQVTIRNLHLESVEKNSYKGKLFKMYADNAAVQSIRLAKVKCYDLEVVKNASDSSSIAFYVNAESLSGAYMYASNCVINSTKEAGVVTTESPYKFYHNGVSYAEGTQMYVKNSGNILDVEMDWNDWEW